jgi:MinD-like ATPase involved in chromosome partitioning or flagellar assembly
VEVPVLVACWSAKGGVGTTVVAASLALTLASRSPTGAIFADLGGDGPAVLGLSDPTSPGLAGWLAAGSDVPADALQRIAVEADHGLTVMPRGEGELASHRASLLASLLDLAPRPTVADCGRIVRADSAAGIVVGHARRSILVTRACYLALRHAIRAPLKPTVVVVVREPGRALSTGDVESTIGAPVVGVIEVDPAVARAVDAGLLSSRIPRSICRGLAGAT